MSNKTIVTLMIVGFIAFISIIGALGDTMEARDPSASFHPQTESGCVYKTYAARYNPVYRGVCELFRDRTFNPDLLTN